MTDAEYEQVRREAREYIARTSFPPSIDTDEYEAHGIHDEYEASRH
ncbi:hypothetical protein [Streptomyces sp. NPDC055085]